MAQMLIFLAGEWSVQIHFCQVPFRCHKINFAHISQNFTHIKQLLEIILNSAEHNLDVKMLIFNVFLDISDKNIFIVRGIIIIIDRE